jgi:hypothetical protein
MTISFQALLASSADPGNANKHSENLSVMMIRDALILTTTLLVIATPTDADELQRAALEPTNLTGWQLQPIAFQTGATSKSPALSQHHCCNKKGAMIGAAVGAAAGALLLHGVCDGDCALGYVKYMAILGGIGATLGAFADAKPAPAPVPDWRLRVAGVLSPSKRAILATVRLGRP